jgi:uncharacterized OB-fold protein
MTRRRAPATCAVCGVDIPPSALACPDCGADERTGWREQSIYDGLDLPDVEPASPPGRRIKPVFWRVVAVAVLAAVLVLVVFNRFWIAP